MQSYVAGSWSPSTIFTYNTTPSTSECRFVCETGYNRNGSACVQNATAGICAVPYGTIASAPPSPLCLIGTPNGFHTAGNGWEWQCLGVNGGQDVECFVDQPLSYSWDISTWSACANNQQTRTVVCKDNNGATVADSLCPQPKPATTQPATCPPVNTCESHYGESCTGTGDTLGYGGSCIGHTQATL